MNNLSDSRWIPTRAGILNLWRYYDETFVFHNGRLLLRGPNGSGKSKALELLLPFLLDADMHPRRLSTFGTASSRDMYWNLMAEGVTGSTRVGYLWLEFTRRDSAETFTCGVRLSASRHRPKVTPDYFTTSARIGEELFLLNEARQGLTVKELKHALGSQGNVKDRADYRDHVRKTLFPSLNPQRYEALLRAMLQLRTPKLSEQLDAGTMSQMLSHALPPMEENQLSGIADGFERLERRRVHVERLSAQHDAAKDLDGFQRRLAQVLLRTAADNSTSSEATRDRAGTQLAQLQREALNSSTAKAENESILDTARREKANQQAQLETILQNPLIEQGRKLEIAEEKLNERISQARKAKKRASEAQSRMSRLAIESSTAAQTEYEHAATLEHSRSKAVGVADTVGLRGIFSAASAQPTQAETVVRSAIREQRLDINRVREAVRDVANEEQRQLSAESQREYERERYDTQHGIVHEAHQRVSHLTEEWSSDVDRWSIMATELRLDTDTVDQLIASVEEPLTVMSIVDKFFGSHAETLTSELTNATAELRTRESTFQSASHELVELENRQQVEPPAPHTRTAQRTDRPGAALWNLVDFIDKPSPGIEAAMEASGLLDAWVMPDGTVEFDTEDTILSPYSEPMAASLANVLKAVPGEPVSPSVVKDLLSRIGFAATASAADGSAAVGADGTWRLAGLTGRWSKENSTFIGASSRRRHRERLIAEARKHVVSCRNAVTSAHNEVNRLRDRRSTLTEERDAFPPLTDIEAALRELDSAQQQLAFMTDHVSQAENALRDAERQASKARHELSQLSRDCQLPDTITELDHRGDLLDEFDSASRTWSTAYQTHAHAASQAAELQERANEAQEAAIYEQEEHTKAHEMIGKQQAIVDTLTRTVGADLHQLQEELKSCREQIEKLQNQESEAHIKIQELATFEAVLGRDIASFEADLDSATTIRDQEFAGLRDLLDGQILSDSRIDFEYTRSENVKATLEVARRIASMLSTSSSGDDAVTRARIRLHEKCQDHRKDLADYANLVFEDSDVGEILVAEVNGERIGPRVLADRLAMEHNNARTELTDEEQGLFAEILRGQVREALAYRMREADELVAGMNSRLERIRTASGMSVRLRWKTREDLDARSEAARGLLLKQPGKLSPEEQATLHTFLADRIDSLRESEDSRPWSEQLKTVFDYTSWHEFEIQFDKGKGWKRLTKKMHSTLSGGEKAVSLHLPLFAALASHYETSPSSPRLLLLDEVLVGVDRANRSQVFDLVRSLDLDAVLTSEHEWGDYAELDGIAIHQVITPPAGDDTVTTVRYVWDGAVRMQDDVQDDLA